MLDFELVSEFTPITRRSFEVATVDANGVTILNPNSANPLVLGEWLELSGNTMIRGSANPAAVPSYCCMGERGRTDMQAIGKAPFLWMGEYEADTLIMTATGITQGEGLEVANVTYGALTRRGLVQFTTGVIVARCTRVPANNNGYLRFMKVSN